MCCGNCKVPVFVPAGIIGLSLLMFIIGTALPEWYFLTDEEYPSYGLFQAAYCTGVGSECKSESITSAYDTAIDALEEVLAAGATGALAADAQLELDERKRQKTCFQAAQAMSILSILVMAGATALIAAAAFGKTNLAKPAGWVSLVGALFGVAAMLSFILVFAAVDEEASRQATEFPCDTCRFGAGYYLYDFATLLAFIGMTALCVQGPSGYSNNI